MDEVAENSTRPDGALPRGRGDRPRRDRRARSRRASPRASSSRSPAASRPRTSAPTGCSRPGRGPALAGVRGRRRADAKGEAVEIEPDEDGDRSPTSSRRSPTPSPGGSTCFRVYLGRASTPTRTSSTSPGAHEGADRPAAAAPRARSMTPVDELGAGDIGAVAKLQGDPRRRRARAPRRRRSTCRALDLPAPVMASPIEPKTKGDEEKAADGDPAPREEDPTLDVHRDPQTGEQIIAGLTPDPRRGDRRPDEAPLRRRDRAAPAARALPGDDPQAREGARPLQEADRRPRPVRRLPHRDRAARRRRRASSSSTRSRAA